MNVIEEMCKTNNQINMLAEVMLVSLIQEDRSTFTTAQNILINNLEKYEEVTRRVHSICKVQHSFAVKLVFGKYRNLCFADINKTHLKKLSEQYQHENEKRKKNV